MSAATFESYDYFDSSDWFKRFRNDLNKIQFSNIQLFWGYSQCWLFFIKYFKTKFKLISIIFSI